MQSSKTKKKAEKTPVDRVESQEKTDKSDDVPEIGGVKGPEPTRYGDWDNNGRCTDF